MHALAIYNFKNWELTFSLSSSSFKLELGLWDSTESRITGKKTLQKLRSGRVYACRGLCSKQLLVRRKGSTCRKSPIMQMTPHKLLNLQIPVLLG